jgi:glutamyl-tRNA reductase
VVPTIVSIRGKAEQIREAELRKTLSHLNDLSETDIKALDVLTSSIVNKLLHDPILFLKRTSHKSRKDVYLDLARKLFNLDEEKPDRKGEEDHLPLDSNDASW